MIKDFLCGYLFLFVGVVCETGLCAVRREMLALNPETVVLLLGRSCLEVLGLGRCPSTHLFA